MSLAFRIGLILLAGLLVITAAVGCVRLGWSVADALDAFVLTNAVMGVGFAGCGVVLAWHRTANPIGWLFVAGGLLQTMSAALAPSVLVAAEAGVSVELVRSARHHGGDGNWGDLLIPVIVTQQSHT